jgi:hypothetical protein
MRRGHAEELFQVVAGALWTFGRFAAANQQLELGLTIAATVLVQGHGQISNGCHLSIHILIGGASFGKASHNTSKADSAAPRLVAQKVRR